ncbi:hypothetical protein F5Y16DRAFT_398754 [Xylariaceae sp. FL0255]|nr:hypothetical protein F5Y16DRAFT_398754 [Xylariaceae sp. FL0255]
MRCCFAIVLLVTVLGTGLAQPALDLVRGPIPTQANFTELCPQFNLTFPRHGMDYHNPIITATCYESGNSSSKVVSEMNLNRCGYNLPMRPSALGKNKKDELIFMIPGF